MNRNEQKYAFVSFVNRMMIHTYYTKIATKRLCHVHARPLVNTLNGIMGFLFDAEAHSVHIDN